MAQKFGRRPRFLVPLISVAMTFSCSHSDSQLRINFSTDLVSGYESTMATVVTLLAHASDVRESKIERISEEQTLGPYEIVTLRVSW